MEAELTDAQPALGRRAVRGAASSVTAQVARILLQIISVVVLARLLTPSDYGLVAMVLVVIGIADLFRDFGLSDAAIQAPVLTARQRDNLFWLNTSIGLVLSLIVMAAAPIIAAAYDQPKLTSITVALAPTFLLSGMMTQYRVDLIRQFRFKALGVIDVSTSALALFLGIGLAVADLGYWALIGQQLASGFIGLALFAAATSWFPGPFRRHSKTLPMVRFGSSLMLSGLASYAALNADSFIVGHKFGPTSLGLYNRGLQLIRTPLRQIQAPLTTVVLATLSRLQDDDERFLRVVKRCQIGLAYPILGVVSVVAVAARDVVTIALGSQWQGASSVITLIAIASGVGTASAPALWIFVARRLATELMYYSLFTTSVIVAAIFIGSMYGVTGVAAGQAIAVLALWPITLFWVGRVSGLTTGQLHAAAVRSLLVTGSAVICGRVVLANANLSSHWASIAAAVATTGLCCLIWAVVPAVRRDYRVVAGMAAYLRRKP